MSFEHHLNLLAYGRNEPASVEAVAARLADMDARLPEAIRDELTRLLDRRPMDVALQLRAALALERQLQEARRINDLADHVEPSAAQLAEAAEYLLLDATHPLAASPAVRTRLVALDRMY